jgi:hypothetical protein
MKVVRSLRRVLNLGSRLLEIWRRYSRAVKGRLTVSVSFSLFVRYFMVREKV